MDRRKRLLLWSLLIAIGLLVYLRLPPAGGPVVQAVMDGVPGADSAAVPESVAKAPASPWMAARTRRYAGLFKDWSCDTLVVPVQVEGGAFDRANRDIMSADLALHLAAAGGCVTDPLLVDIALEDGLRRRDQKKVLDLARAIKAQRIVLAWAGHDEGPHMRVTLQVLRYAPWRFWNHAAVVAAHSFDHLDFDQARPPFAVFHAELPRMLAAVGLPAAAAPAPASGGMPAALPASLDEYRQAQSGPPLEQGARLAFLAMLAPSQDWRAGDRLFSKAWVALQQADDNDPAVRLLRARILFHLRERPYALEQLGHDGGPAADGLRAALNGNLPQARAALAQVQGPWEQLFLGLEVHDLELSYHRDPRATGDNVMRLVGHSPWQPLLRWRLGDRDVWTTGTTLEFKSLLDASFPVAGYSLDDFRAGRGAPQDLAAAEMTSLRHVYRLVEEQPRLWCCGSVGAAARPADLLDLLDSRIEYALGRQASFYYSPQGAYDHALELLKRYDELLAGSPCAEALRVDIYLAQRRRGELGKSAELEKSIRESARSATWWDQGQTIDTRNTLWYIYQPPQDPAAPYLAHYGEDFPIRDYWNGSNYPVVVERRLDYSSDNPEPLEELVRQGDEAQRQEYLKLLDSRFIGGTSATQLRLDHLPPQQKTPEYLQAQITTDPDNYRYYSTLGHLLIDRNDFAGTSRVMLSYPEYKEQHPNNSVDLANHASSWGHALFWMGAFDEARPLLQLAADYDNGSEASTSSQARLALLDGNYGDAAAGFLEGAQHYNDIDTYREFLDLSFASGQDRAGWALFDRLSGKYDVPYLWWAAITAQRKAGLDQAGMRDWVRQRLGQLPSGADRDDLYTLALVQSLVDRTAPADLAPYLLALAGPTAERPKLDHLQNDTDPSLQGPRAFGALSHAPLSGQPLPNRFALLAEAMAAMRAGRHAEAVAAFDRLSAFYQVEDGSMAFALPYFAYAASRSGDTLELGPYLAKLPEAYRNYSTYLALAVFSAASGRHAEALEQLDRAYHRWPYALPLRLLRSGYEYLDICAMLYDSTRDPRYRDAGLRLARTLRRAEPSRAYAHAYVAYFGDREDERVEALATALYLDPQSRWAALAPAALHAKAAAWSHRHPLFTADTVWQKKADEAAAGE